jgi:hypothetical protein
VSHIWRLEYWQSKQDLGHPRQPSVRRLRELTYFSNDLWSTIAVKEVILRHKPLKLISQLELPLRQKAQEGLQITNFDKKLSYPREHLDLEISTHLKQYLIVLCLLQILSHHFPLSEEDHIPPAQRHTSRETNPFIGIQ